MTGCLLGVGGHTGCHTRSRAAFFLCCMAGG